MRPGTIQLWRAFADEPYLLDIEAVEALLVRDIAQADPPSAVADQEALAAIDVLVKRGSKVIVAELERSFTMASIRKTRRRHKKTNWWWWLDLDPTKPQEAP